MVLSDQYVKEKQDKGELLRLTEYSCFISSLNVIVNMVIRRGKEFVAALPEYCFEDGEGDRARCFLLPKCPSATSYFSSLNVLREESLGMQVNRRKKRTKGRRVFCYIMISICVYVFSRIHVSLPPPPPRVWLKAIFVLIGITRGKHIESKARWEGRKDLVVYVW